MRAAKAAGFHKDGYLNPFLWNSTIFAMRISITSPQRSDGRNLEHPGFQGFRLFPVWIVY